VAKIEEFIKERISILESAPIELEDAAKKAQLVIWKEIETKLDKLKLSPEGNILANNQNVRVVTEIIATLRASIVGEDFTNAMKSFVDSFDTLSKISDNMGKEIDNAFKPITAQKELLKIAKTNAIEALIGSGLQTKLTQPFVELLTANVAAGNSITETRKQLREFTLGTKDVDGRVLANVRTFARTAIGVADSTYANGVAIQVGAVWFRYAGRVKDTTRTFCRERADKFYHRKEIELWPKEDDWDGMIKGTDAKNIFNFKGGWNCGHSINMVNIRVVPKDVIDRNIANGNYKK